MSASIGPNTSDSSLKQNEAPTAAERAALQADLEERLAEARIQRAKVLAARELAKKKANLEQTNKPVPQGGPATGKPPLSTGKPSDIPKPVPRGRVRPDISVPAVPIIAEQMAEPEQRRRRAVPLSVMIAFACFFGLGFGVVASLGLVVGLGWVSVSDLNRPAVSNTAPEVSPVAPAALAVDAYADVPSGIDVARPTPRAAVVASQPSAIPQLGESGDGTLAAVMSPAPQVEAALTNIVWTSFPQETPKSLAPVSANPAPAVWSKPPKALARPFPEAMPAVLERSPVRARALAVSLSGPVIEAALPALPAQAVVPPDHGPIVALFDVQEDQRPEVQQAPMGRPVLEPLLRASLSPSASAPVTAVAPIDQFGAVPRVVQPAALLAQPKPLRGLPQIGGPVERPLTLAAKLGGAGEDVSQIALFAYAPTSVSADALNEKLGDLATTGFPLAETSRVNFRVSKTHVRYYTRADETVARAIAAELGGAARDFTRERIAAPAGRIEVWMAGTRVGAPKPRTVAASPQRRAALKAEQQARVRTQLKNRLVDSLRSKEYLR
ncbi:hypothetical protein [Roseobacter sinensis]|uniref:SPOR domain-containing protein n=1 Tax=Roseobacter sinensis TaxID=2931391 RepID=A0ABT3BCM9_9RHOB|nr:hypothetical protein [Roseobacter sp. WL0113]MCV3271315.1 hypothetical protein [Roseobacter sp. WL0113]